MGLPSAMTEASTPLVEREAQGNNSLDVSQRGAVIGEVIPIVFARRVSGVGGVLISPAATEARFENSLTNEVTGFYHLVLGEGPMDSLQVRDVFQRSCRVGSFSQTYNKRAGTFIPGNFIVARSGYTTPECPSYCGTGGTYTGLSTLAFQATYPNGVTQWNRQVHCFVRGGLYVTRLIDSTLGPSNNVADLLRYLLRSSSRVPDAQIDAAGSFLAAATFTNVNGFWFNGSISASTNLRDWIGRNLQYFLLRLARVGGKEALTPLLPTNANGTIKTTAVTWEFTFTEQHIIPDTFEIDYTSLADRKPFAAMMLWRQQDDLGIPLIRTAEVRYPGTAIDGPFEQHDLSAFCASENHAVKVGTYIISRRNHITHRLRIGVKPDAFNPTLAAGDLVRVRLERTPSTGAASVHDYLYEVDRIGKSISGEVRLELTHFPVDADLASVVAKEVNAAVGAGFVLPTGLSGITCDVNLSSDTSVPADTSLDPGDWDLPDDGDFDIDVTEVDPVDFPGVIGVGGGGGGGGSGGGGGGDPAEDNPEDDKPNQEVPPGPQPQISGSPLPGETLTFDPGCPDAYIEWRLVDNETGEEEVVSEGVAIGYAVPGGGIPDGKSLVGVGRCPDPSSPDGYGPEIVSPPVETPLFQLTQFASKIEFYVVSANSNRTRCDNGDVIQIGDTTSGFVGAATAPFQFDQYSAPSPGSANVDCVCGVGGAAVGPDITVIIRRSDTGQSGSVTVNAGNYDCAMFAQGGFRAFAQTRAQTYSVIATDNSGNPII
jgi:hypothetical protein